MKLIRIAVLLFTVCNTALSQIFVDRNACIDEAVSVFSHDEIAAEASDNGFCSGLETVITFEVTDDQNIADVTVVSALDRTPTFNVSWVGNQEGYIEIAVSFRKWLQDFPSGCKISSSRYMYTYRITRQGHNPGGNITGVAELLAAEPQNGVTFNLEYLPSPSYPADLPVSKIRYFNGQTNVEQDVVKDGDGYLPTPIAYKATSFGYHDLEVQVLACNTEYALLPKKLKVVPTCINTDPGQISIFPEGPGITPYADGSFRVMPSQEYSLIALNIIDFASHYEWTSIDGGSDVVLNGNSFTVLKDLGSYKITAVAKEGREECPVPPQLQLVLGDPTVIIEQTCSIVFPEDLGDFGYEISPGNFVLEHFTVTAKSKRSITVMPGVTLDLGAELVLEVADPEPEGDLSLNYTQATSYDEYGRVISNSRSYFDDRGLAVQTQYKNLSSGVVMANETLYDALGRPVISTLSAPVRANEDDDEVDECNEVVPADDRTRFAFKSGFVKAEGVNYNYSQFDLSKEQTPVGVDASEEGTLGWYYGTNNGNSTNPRMNEPLVAVTQFPYSRTLFHHDGTGNVKSTTKPGDVFRAGGGHLGTTDVEIVSASDQYLQKYLDMREAELGLTGSVLGGEFFRNVLIDETGKKTVTYTDRSDKAIIALYFGSQSTPITKSYQFYDLTGRLIVKVSPNGVAQYERATNPVAFASIDKTTYSYNHKGLLVAIEETDAEITDENGNVVKGTTEYFYRKDGKIRFSQNPKQSKSTPYQTYSYTNYDGSGRPIESGEYIIKPGGIIFKSPAMIGILESTDADGGLTETNQNKQYKVTTFYDEPDAGLPADRVQRFIQGAVSYTKKDNAIVTSYSYDEQGRVEWMVQKIDGLGIKTIDYRYGPTGQVQEVLYQKGNAAEQFSHFYEYDADGRLFKAYTTTDELSYNKFGKLTNAGVTYDDATGYILNSGNLKLQASYIYYLHGPLKRIELADKLQGIDYVYTPDGALKAINNANPDATATTAAAAKDPGKDGFGNNFRKDVFGMSLEYFTGDYLGANDVTDNATISELIYPQQHGGLIRAMRWHSPIEPNKQFAYAYDYDNRDQFKTGDWGEIKAGSFSIDDHAAYNEKITGYDLNGNINSLQRKNAEGDDIANFDYQYLPNTNKLGKILDKSNNNAVLKTYQYNEIGELTSETGAAEKHIEYDVAGKVTKVFRDAAKTKLTVFFTYDDRGFRLSKTSYDENGLAQTRTWYVRDATGNVMGTYEQNIATPQEPKITELPVYANGRVGLYKPEFDFTMYELTDHLGNVRAVIGKTLEIEYLATMESERLTKESVEHEGHFEDVANDVTSTDINHTPASITVNGVAENIADPNEVERINNRPAGTASPNPIGTGIMLSVHPGDVINAEVFVKYANFDAADENIVAGLAGFLTSVFGASPAGVDVPSIFNAVDEPAFALMPAWSKLNDQQPRAFLNYLFFDNDFTLKDFDFAQASSAARITEETLTAHHERLALENIKIEKEGFLYIYVSNQSDQNMDVYFDDLRIKHTYSDIVAGGDFYPFGLSINDRQIQRDFYRHGYQGQFSEKDEETGWNHFELREYDPVIGRWIVPDPARQYSSPYMAFGNNPTSRTDPDGGTDGEDGGGLSNFPFSIGFSIWSALKHSAEAPARVYKNYLRNRSVGESMWEATKDFGGDIAGLFTGETWSKMWEGYKTDFDMVVNPNAYKEELLGQMDETMRYVTFDASASEYAYAMTRGTLAYGSMVAGPEIAGTLGRALPKFELLSNVGFKTIWRGNVANANKYWSGFQIGGNRGFRLQFHKHYLRGSSDYFPHINIGMGGRYHIMLNKAGARHVGGWIFRGKLGS